MRYELSEKIHTSLLGLIVTIFLMAGLLAVDHISKNPTQAGTSNHAIVGSLVSTSGVN